MSKSSTLVYLDDAHLTQVYKQSKALNLIETYKRTLSVEYGGAWQDNVFVVITDNLQDALDLARSIYNYIITETSKLSTRHPFRACVCSHLDHIPSMESITSLYRYVSGTMFVYTTKTISVRKNEYLLSCPIKYLRGEEVKGFILLPKTVIPKYLVVKPGKSAKDLAVSLASDVSWDNFALVCNIQNEYETCESDTVAISVLYDVNRNSPVIRHAINLYNCGYDKEFSAILSCSISTNKKFSFIYIEGLVYKFLVFDKSPNSVKSDNTVNLFDFDKSPDSVIPRKSPDSTTLLESPLIKTDELRSLHYILKPSNKMREFAKIISCK